MNNHYMTIRLREGEVNMTIATPGRGGLRLFACPKANLGKIVDIVVFKLERGETADDIARGLREIEAL